MMNPADMIPPGLITTVMFSMVAFAVLIGGYFFIFWDQRRDDSPLRGDNQVGLKLALYTLLIIALGIAVSGLDSVLWYLLSGTKAGGSDLIKSGIASLLSGGGAFAAVMLLFLPRTNASEFNKVERYALGAVTVASGVMALGSLTGVLNGLFTSASWPATSGDLSSLLIFGALLVLALMRFGALSGWTVPVRPQMPMGPPGGGYPPQQGGPPQGGYPPQQGGYPPQQGGYPPQGGGYPPQGGGYPPQGGGGLPPPQGSGGGYPPQGGGGFQPR